MLALFLSLSLSFSLFALSLACSHGRSLSRARAHSLFLLHVFGVTLCLGHAHPCITPTLWQRYDIQNTHTHTDTVMAQLAHLHTRLLTPTVESLDSDGAAPLSSDSIDTTIHDVSLLGEGGAGKGGRGGNDGESRGEDGDGGECSSWKNVGKTQGGQCEGKTLPQKPSPLLAEASAHGVGGTSSSGVRDSVGVQRVDNMLRELLDDSVQRVDDMLRGNLAQGADVVGRGLGFSPRGMHLGCARGGIAGRGEGGGDMGSAGARDRRGKGGGGHGWWLGGGGVGEMGEGKGEASGWYAASSRRLFFQVLVCVRFHTRAHACASSVKITHASHSLCTCSTNRSQPTPTASRMDHGCSLPHIRHQILSAPQ